MHNNQTKTGLFHLSLILLLFLFQPTVSLFAQAPVVTGTSSPTNNQNPTWSWTSAGGTGVFTYRLRKDTITQFVETDNSVSYTSVAKLVAGQYTMSVKEQNADGSWTANGLYKIRIDTTAPKYKTIGIVGAIDPGLNTNTNPFVAKITFDETVLGFNASGISVTNGTKDDLSFASTSVNGTTYTIKVTPLVEGPVNVTVLASAVKDSASNENKEKTLSVKYDLTVPVLSQVTLPESKLYRMGEVLEFDVLFNDYVIVDKTSGTPYIPLIVGSNSVKAFYSGLAADKKALAFKYTIAEGDSDWNGIEMTPIIRRNKGFLLDSAGNAVDSVLSSVGSTTGIHIDGISPRIISFTASTQTLNGTVPFNIVFSKPVKVLVSGFFTITYSSMSPLDLTTNIYDNTTATHPLEYTVSPVYDNAPQDSVDSVYCKVFNVNLIIPAISGNLRLKVTKGVTTDSVSNGNLESNEITKTVDNYGPTVKSIVLDQTYPTPFVSDTINSRSVRFIVSFKEITSHTIKDLGVSDFKLTNPDTSQRVTGVISAVTMVNDTVYNVTVTDITGDGSLRLDVKQDTSFQDGFGNNYSGAGFFTGSVFNFDFTPPHVISIARFSPTTPTFGNISSSVTYQVLFSQKVSGVDISDFDLVTTGSVGGIGTLVLTSVPNTGERAYKVQINKSVSFTGDGTMKLNLKASGTGIMDKATNLCAGFTDGQTYTMDNQKPTPTLSYTINPTIASAIPIHIEFNEKIVKLVPGTTFKAASLAVLTNAKMSISNLLPVFNDLKDSIHFTFYIEPLTVGSVSVQLNAALIYNTTKVTDLALNQNLGSNLLSFYVTQGIITTSPAFGCSAGSLALGATGTGTTLNWYDVASGGTSLGTGNTFTTPFISATTTYYVESSDGIKDNTSPRVPVVATIYSTPVVSGISSERCFPGSVELKATTSVGDLYWYDSPIGGTNLSKGTSYTTPPISATTSFYVEGVNVGCKTPTRTEVVAVVKELPAQTSAIVGNIGVVKETQESYSVDNVQGATYKWHVDTSTLASTINSAIVDWNKVGRQTVSVEAVNVCGSSDSRSLTVWVSEILPTVPVLVTPVKDSVEAPITVKLGWNIVNNATSYDVQVSTSSTFEGAVSATTGNISALGIADTSYTFGPLDGGVTYYWRVKAKNTVGATDWSEIWSFTTTTSTGVLSAIGTTCKLYPNPVGDVLSVESAEELRGVSVYSSDNKLLIANLASGKSAKVGVNSLISGVYLVKVETTKGSYTLKMLKE